MFQAQDKNLTKPYIALRLRPSNSPEKFCNKVDNYKIGISQSKDQFQFQRVFDEHDNTQKIFDVMMMPIIDNSINGSSALICAYGQTSSGKTYTMRGSSHQPGLILLTAQYLFNQTETQNSCSIYFRYFEIYMEKVYDLMSNKEKNHIRCKKDIKNIEIQSFNEMKKLYLQADQNKHQAQTQQNLNSSRSHTILEFQLINQNGIKSLITFADLAGSEALQFQDNIRLQEGIKINKSLSNFCSVLNILKENKGQFINYRDSQLTLSLKNSLQGDCQLGFIFTINQSNTQASQSLQTLQLSRNIGSIKIQIKNNQQKMINYNQDQQLNKQQQIIDLQQQQIEQLNEQLKIKQLEQDKSNSIIRFLETNINQLQDKVNEMHNRNNSILQRQKQLFQQYKEQVYYNKAQTNHHDIYQQEKIMPLQRIDNTPLSRFRRQLVSEQKLQYSNCRSNEKLPQIFEKEKGTSIYQELKQEKCRNALLEDQFLHILSENIHLQKQNSIYEIQISRQLDEYEYENGDMKHFYENMEITQIDDDVIDFQIQKIQSEQTINVQAQRLIEQLNLNENGSARYIEKLFRFMEITFGQDNEKLQQQFAEFLDKDK